MNTPVTIIIYNRYKNTIKLFDVLKKIEPSQLFVIADGPKENDVEDEKNIMQTRSILDSIDWDCNVTKIYREHNLGLEKNITLGLNEVFSNVQETIILEDDCIPNESFFQFCTELLKHYKDNKEIVQISGTKYIPNEIRYHSYYYSKYSIEWGWATWKDRWERYDALMEGWPNMRKKKDFRDLFSSNKTYKYWRYIFDNCYKGNINSWAYKWLYNNLIEHGYSIIPSVNLVENIGVGINSTNTFLSNKKIIQQVKTINYPLIYHDKVIHNNNYDVILEKLEYTKSVLWLELITMRMKPYIKKILK